MNKSASRSIEESVSNSLSFLENPASKVVIGVSGGPDSMALLYTLFKEKKETFVVHINYGLRGKESDLDQELVEGMASEWGFECCSIRIDIKKNRGNFQNEARKERYRIFKELKEEIGAEAILTAHHKDDQVETILQKLFRGSGPEAWQALKVWDGTLLRPLLNHDKKEILEFCRKQSVPFRIDQSNSESVYARNFLRNELSDSLDNFFPGWKENILGLSEMGKINEAAFNHILESILNKGKLDLELYQKLDSKLKPVIIKKYIEHQIPEVHLSKGLINELSTIHNLQTGSSIRIAGNINLFKGRTEISINEENEFSQPENTISKKEAIEGLTLKNVSFNITTSNNSVNNLRIDSETLYWPISIRPWNSGDRFIPLGMSGSQKVSDHLTNRKIPSAKREKALILSGVDGTIYAIIFPETASNGEIGSISELAKCTESTKKYLTIKLK